MTELTEAFEISPESVEQYHDGKAWPLPRLNSLHQSSDDKFEVIISGAGPAGKKLAQRVQESFNMYKVPS